MACFVQEFNRSPHLITGRYIAHAHMDLHARAFSAADLHKRKLALVDPTVVQSAQLWRATYAHAALRKSDEERSRVIAGLDPLIMPWVRALPAPATVPSDDEFVVIAHRVGPNHWLSAAAAAGI